MARFGFEQVIKESGVSRTTAYRRWPSKASFLADVLVAAVRTTTLTGESPEQIEDLRHLLTTRTGDIATEQGRRNLIVAALRESVQQDVGRVVASPQWRTYFALTATLRGLPEGEIRDEVGAALAETDRDFTERRRRVYERLATIIGYRLAPGFAAGAGFEGLASAMGTIMTGIVVKVCARPDLLTETTVLAPFGSTEHTEWTAPALQAVGFLLASLEPDRAIAWDAQRVAAVRDALGEIEVELWNEAQRAAAPPR